MRRILSSLGDTLPAVTKLRPHANHLFPFPHSSYVICIVAAITLYMILARENKKRDAAPVNEEERAKLAFQDLTDMENPYFRYVY